MRKWKIRTKMIAGLVGLAMVLGMLVYGSWSQLVRDKGLANEISQLADEIDHANNLNRLADLIRRSHSHLQPDNQPRGMIDTAALEQLENEQDVITIDDALVDLRIELEDYKEAIERHTAQRSATNLLVDRGQQQGSLDEIDQTLTSCAKHWHRVTGFDRAVLAIEDYHFATAARFERLVELTNSHFDSIHQGMKAFRDNVQSEQRNKLNRFWGFTGLATFLIAFLAWSFWTLIMVPFRTLFSGSQLIAKGHHQHKILLGTNDEMGMMADTVNDITDRFNRAMNEVTRAKLDAEQQVRDRTREVIRKRATGQRRLLGCRRGPRNQQSPWGHRLDCRGVGERYRRPE